MSQKSGGGKNGKPSQRELGGFPLWVGGGLLSHALAQYHRRCGA